VPFEVGQMADAAGLIAVLTGLMVVTFIGVDPRP